MHTKRLLVGAALFCAGATGAVALAQQVVFQPVMKAGGGPAEKATSNKTETQAEADKKALQVIGLKDDDYPKLIAFLKDRTLSQESMANIQALIKKFEWNVPFDDRIAAQDQLIKIGGPAVAPLKLAIKDDKEAETTFRAKETLKRMEKEKSISGEVTAAVVRALGKSKTPEAVEALFGFLPLADTTQLIDLIQQAVISNAGEPGKPNPTLVKALDDPNDARRRVAAIALASGGTEKERIRFKEIHPRLIEMAKVDKDNSLRFELSRILLIECREKQAVAFLIDTLPASTRGQSWVVEELLVQIAGKDAPKERCKHGRGQGDSKEPSSNKMAREKVRDAWKKWWTANSDKIDLTKLNLKQTLRGEFVMMIQTWNGRQQIQVTEYARDDSVKNRYAFENNSGFMDMIYLDGDRTLMMDGNSFNLVERDSSGKTIVTRTVPDGKKANGRNFGFQGKTMQLLPNGNILVVSGNGFVELDKEFKEVSRYTRPDINNQPQFDVSGAHRMTDGRTVVLLSSNRLFTLDDKMKEDKERKSVTTQAPAHRQNIAQSGEDKVMVLEQSQIVEYDLKTGKAEPAKVKEVYNAICLQRLPNGNVMFVDQNNYPNSVVEKTATGEEVFRMNIPDNNGNIVKGMVK
jgi:hypothetical protein